MRADADRGRERVAGEVVRRCGRGRAAMTAIARGADLDDTIDVSRRRRMACATIAAHVHRGRWRRAVTTGAVAAGRRIVPARLRGVAAGCGQYRTMAIHVAACRTVERRRSTAHALTRRQSCARTEHDGHRPRDRDAIVKDVTVVVPLCRRDVALAARDRRCVGLMRVARRTRRAVTRRACGRPVDMTRQTRHAGDATFEVGAVTTRARGEVPVAAQELLAVKHGARRIEKADRVDRRRRAVRRARRAQRALVCATREEQHNEQRFQGSPWRAPTS